LVGSNKELSKDSVFSKEVIQTTSPINYVLMLTESIDGVVGDLLALTEAELFIKRLFVQGDYKHYADKFKLDRSDLKRILFEASIFLSKKKISCSIAIILKSSGENREIIVSRINSGSAYIINTQEVRLLTEDDSYENIISEVEEPEEFVRPQLFRGKLNQEDTLLLCSETLSEALELKFVQRIVNSSKGPEEICKKLLHSAAQTGRKDIISVAVFNGSVVKKNLIKGRISNKNLLLIILLPFLIVIGFIIYNVSSGSKDKQSEKAPVETFDFPSPPPVETTKNSNVHPSDLETRKPKDDEVALVPKNNDKIIKKTITKLPAKEVKKVKKEVVEAPEETLAKFKKVNFLVNGSVVLISNWESVRKGIKSVNWENGISDKKRIHKYSDYSNIPSSVKIIFMDNSTKSYSIK
jgi:hypothetical protein